MSVQINGACQSVQSVHLSDKQVQDHVPFIGLALSLYSLRGKRAKDLNQSGHIQTKKLFQKESWHSPFCPSSLLIEVLACLLGRRPALSNWLAGCAGSPTAACRYTVSLCLGIQLM